MIGICDKEDPVLGVNDYPIDCYIFESYSKSGYSVYDVCSIEYAYYYGGYACNDCIVYNTYYGYFTGV